MARVAKAVCKNTFISFVPDEAMEDASQPRVAPRSKSADATRSRPTAEEFEELAQQSMQRINAVLCVGMSSPLQLPQKARAESAPMRLDLAERLDDAAECPSGVGVGLSELRTLQGKLAKALGSPAPTGWASPQQKPWDKGFRVSSNCSLSTMAPDDGSECGELPSSSGMKRMPHVVSSGSVCTMVSDFSLAEDDTEVAFELRGMEVPTGADGAKSKVTPEMSHSQVPRNQNMAEMYNATKDAGAPTTMMIRNIPGRYSQNDLMMDMKDLGLAGTYDFLYMPMDKGTAANVGYSFVNFVEPKGAEDCLEAFSNFRFTRHQRSSNKFASVSVAHLQGLEKNLQHYENAAVNMSKEKRRRPVVVANIAKMFG